MTRGPRLVVEVTDTARDDVVGRAVAHGYATYSKFVLAISLRGILLHPDLRKALGTRAVQRGWTLKEEVEHLILAGLKSEQAS